MKLDISTEEIVESIESDEAYNLVSELLKRVLSIDDLVKIIKESNYTEREILDCLDIGEIYSYSEEKCLQ